MKLGTFLSQFCPYSLCLCDLLGIPLLKAVATLRDIRKDMMQNPAQQLYLTSIRSKLYPKAEGEGISEAEKEELLQDALAEILPFEIASKDKKRFEKKKLPPRASQRKDSRGDPSTLIDGEEYHADFEDDVPFMEDEAQELHSEIAINLLVRPPCLFLRYRN